MDQHVQVMIAEGDERQLAGLGADDYVEFEGSINGAPVSVRFYRGCADDERGPTTLNGLASGTQQLRVADTCSQCRPGHDRGDGRCERHGKLIAP
jgi:hypothetical protein